MKISHEQLLGEMKLLAPSLRVLAEQSVVLVPQLIKAAIGEEAFKGFFKVPPTCRLKDEASALAKLDRWASVDSASEMIDLAGSRFVVLLRTDLDLVEKVIRDYTGWTVTRSRHFEYEVASSPKAFDYQSIHLVVHAAAGSTINGALIDHDVSCEVQIRTLLQHAFAELCHDRIYKSEYVIPSDSTRVVARCMALMETTDLMFCDAVGQIEQVQKSCDAWCEALVEGHEKILLEARPAFDPTCRLLVETFWRLLAGVSHKQVLQVTEARALRTKLAKRRSSALFSSAGCLLAYWLVKNHLIETSKNWPEDSSRESLTLIGADLGINI